MKTCGLKGLPVIQKTNTMKKTNIKKTLVAALTLCAALSASAQSMQNTASAPPPPAYDSWSGLIGSNYAEFQFGYQKEAARPDPLHDYGVTLNQAVTREGDFGLDANLTSDYLTGGAVGYHDYRNDVLFGFTGYMVQDWGKPFLTVDGGAAFQQAADITSDSYAYAFTSGVEFRVAQSFFITPFVAYQAAPDLQDHHAGYAYLPNYLWNFGAKATYRFTSEWSASLTAEQDQHNARDLGFRAGVEFRY